MPIYEYLCAPCHCVFSFMHATMADARPPPCPRCGRGGMTRRLSRFAFVRGGKDPFAAIPGDGAEPPPGAPEHDERLYFAWRSTDRQA
jgi:putative FmdB family regulatory protein